MKQEIKDNANKDDDKESDKKEADKPAEDVKKEEKPVESDTTLKADEVIVKPEAIVNATKDVVIEKPEKDENLEKKPDIPVDDKKEVKDEVKEEVKVEVKSDDKKVEKPVVEPKKDDKSSVVLSVPFLKTDEKPKDDVVINLDNIPVIQSTSDVLNSSIRSGASNVTTLANSSATPRRSEKDLLKTGTLNSSGTVGINSNIPKVKIGKEDKPEIKKPDVVKIDEAKLDDKSINKSNFIDIPSILRQ